MQYSRGHRIHGTPASMLNRVGLAILAILCFPPMLFIFIFWADAEGFRNRAIATALAVLLLGLDSMAINGAVTGRVRLTWLFAPMVIVVAVWLIFIALL